MSESKFENPFTIFTKSSISGPLRPTHPTIEFTSGWSQKSINFLDVTVSLINGQSETDLYHAGIYCSKLTIEALEQGVKYVQS